MAVYCKTQKIAVGVQQLQLWVICECQRKSEAIVNHANKLDHIQLLCDPPPYYIYTMCVVVIKIKL